LLAQNDSLRLLKKMKWLCCQLGAREHYAIPRALFRLNLLDRLVTDAWVPPSSFLGKVCGRRLADRFHGDLREARVIAFNSSLILFEMLARARALNEWKTIIARNRWFQRKVASFLRSQLSTLNVQPMLLSYSYSALEPFRYAKSQGWKTVLVQIDPGPKEEKIVAEEAARVPALANEWQPAPAQYWASWQEEYELADRIVVNSQWSRDSLICSGVPNGKLAVIPLAYEPPDITRQQSAVRPAQSYGAPFTRERPMRVLFLGQVNLRKGVARLLDAETYRAADVFILPTLSDGFAITQLEAQAHSLPVITSRFCGGVIESGRNGMILDEPSAACIAAAIRDCIADPSRLQHLAAASRVAKEFTIDALAQRLQELGGTL